MQDIDMTAVSRPRPKRDRKAYLYRWKKAQKVLAELRDNGGTAA